MKQRISLLFFLLISLVFARDYYKVSKVIDGDTIDLDDGTRVRLIGVDAPEKSNEALEFVKNMVEGKNVRLELDQETRDRYNRLLAYVYLEDGTFLNAELLKKGHAKVATYPPNTMHLDLFTYLQNEARKEKVGLWKVDQSTPEQVIPQEQPAPQGLIAIPKEPVQVKSEPTTETVYITKSGTKYHRGNCVYLKKSKIPISLKEAGEKGYAPCSVCKPASSSTKAPSMLKQSPSNETETTVYVTKTGTKYHRAGCSYLRKSSIPMSLSQAKGRYSPCSKCSPPR